MYAENAATVPTRMMTIIAATACASSATSIANGRNAAISMAPPISMPQAVTTAEPYVSSSLPGCTV